METYRFAGSVLSSVDPAFGASLAKAYSDKSRPVCMCMPSIGVQMYVCRFNDRFLVKRMPNTGSHHHPDCVSYEPPPELSGLGEVAGVNSLIPP